MGEGNPSKVSAHSKSPSGCIIPLLSHPHEERKAELFVASQRNKNFLKVFGALLGGCQKELGVVGQKMNFPTVLYKIEYLRNNE